MYNAPTYFAPTYFAPHYFATGSGSSPPTPALTLSPSTATAVDGGSPVSLTAILVGTTGPLAASVSGGGTLSTATPDSGDPFTWTAPGSGSGVATVTVELAGLNPFAILPQTSVITYGPAMTYTFRDVLNAGSAGLNIVAQLVDDHNSAVGSPLAGILADKGNTIYSFTATLPVTATGYINYYVSGTPGTVIWSSVVSPPLDPPGLAALLAAMEAVQDDGQVEAVNSPTSIVVSGLSIPYQNLYDLLCVLNDGVTGGFKGSAAIRYGLPVSAGSSDIVLALGSPGFPVVAVGDQVEIVIF